jgi:hypothetical protein
VTGWTVLAGCGKTTLARENFEGPHVWYNSRTLPQDAQKGRSARPFQFSLPLFRGAAEVALYCAHRTSTVSSCAFCEQEGHLAAPLPLLADFFSILLESGQRLMTISRATLPLGPKGF